MADQDRIGKLIERARAATGELRDAAREGRVIDFRKRDPLVAAIHDAFDELEALLASPGSVSDQGWRDISTAPKDGTLVLLWWRSEMGRDLVAYWATGYWKEFGDGSRGWIGESFHASEPKCWTRLVGERPTHWMPMPQPPLPAPPVSPAQGEPQKT